MHPEDVVSAVTVLLRGFCIVAYRAREQMHEEAPDMVTSRASVPEEDFRDFFDNAAMSFDWVGRDGTILAANQAELDLLGYESHEYVGRNIAEFYVDETQISDILRELAAGEVMTERPSLLRCKNGTTKEVMITSTV